MRYLAAITLGAAYAFAVSRMLGCCEHHCGGRRK